MKKLPRHVVETNRRTYNRYMRTMKNVRSTIWNIQDRDERKRVERDVAYLVNKINNYGFTFFPDTYVEPIINELQAIVNNHK